MGKDFTITYKDEPVGVREATTAASTSQQSFARLTDMLKDGNTAPQRATFEDGYWILGPDFRLFPDDPAASAWGLFSQQMSGPDGLFSPPVVLTLDLHGVYSSVGITMEFDPYGPTWCSDLTIVWYRSGTAVHAQDFQPDGWQYTCYAEVSSFDKAVITFRQMSAGYRYLKMQALTYGITRIFDSSECYDIDLFQDTDLIGDTVSVNTLDFVLRNRSGINFLFQRKQLMLARFGAELLDIYYISTAKKQSGGKWSVHTVDQIGLAEMAGDHAGGIYAGTPAGELAEDILGPGFEVVMDDSLSSIPIYGHLPKASKRDNLQQLAFALSAMVVTAHREHVEIVRLSRERIVSAFGGLRSYENGSVSSSALVTAVNVTAHEYVLSGSEETLYDSVLNGMASIDFSEPMGGLVISGGSIEASCANLAIIRGTGQRVTLTGRKYSHIKRVWSKSNPLRNVNDVDNEVSYSDMTLVSPHNVEDVLAACYAHSLRLDTVEGKVLTETERPGDYVEVLTDEDGIKRGHLISLDYVASTKLAANAVVLADYEGDDAG